MIQSARRPGWLTSSFRVSIPTAWRFFALLLLMVEKISKMNFVKMQKRHFAVKIVRHCLCCRYCVVAASPDDNFFERAGRKETSRKGNWMYKLIAPFR